MRARVSFRNSVARGLPEEFPSHRCEPFLRMIVSVQFLIEREEPCEVAALRVDRGRRLAGDLGHEVHPREREQAVPPLFEELRNVMLLIMCRNERQRLAMYFGTAPPLQTGMSAT